MAGYDTKRSGDDRELSRNSGDLRDGQSLFLSLVHSIPACFLRKDRESRVVFANEKFADFFGKSVEELIGKRSPICTNNNSQTKPESLKTPSR